MTIRNNVRACGVFALALVAILFAAGCQPPQTYVLTGRVISKRPATQQMVIDNDDIPGFMAAMTMPYQVKDPAGMEKVQPADMIRADVVVGPDGKFWLEHLAVIGKAPTPASSPEGAKTRTLMIGDKAPDVPMVNQDGKTVRFSQFKGNAVLLTFVYTRCPFPDYCPLMSSHFADIQKELAKNPGDYQKTHLVSISLDPKFDTPPVLRKYAMPYVGNDPKGFEHWDFVHTTPADLQTLTLSFGLSLSGEGDQLSHSLNTVLLAPDGTLANMWPGNEWQTSEVLDVMRHTAESVK